MDVDHCFEHDESLVLIRELVAQIKTYLSAPEINRVVLAFKLSEQAHRHQRRKSGEPYIIHPIAVATILAQMHLDCETIMAALLHDVIEDTDYEKDYLNQEFGKAVAEMVDGVSKLHNLNDKSKAEKTTSKKEVAAASFHKMMLAVTRDIRVIIIKLADRLHNMRTQWFMSVSTRRRKARETLDIYAPIADRLGLGRMRDELIELGFSGYYPFRSRVIRHYLQQYHESHSKAIQQLELQLNQWLEKHHVISAVKFIPQQNYNIYKELRKTFKDTKDSVTFRIIVKDADNCYRALGVIHQLYQPKTAQSIIDHIAIPNANQSQALHSTVVGSKDFKFINIQICTWEMWAFTEFGITVSESHKNTHEWVRNVLSLLNNTSNSLDFFEHIKADLQPNEICIFTSKHEIFTLPKGATIVDFAYALHSDLGDHLVNAKIDGNDVSSLNTILESGQRVELITNPEATPCPEWLNFAVTGRARSHILKFLKKLNREQAIVLGHRLLDHELNRFGKTFDLLSESALNGLLSTFKCKTREDLLVDIGLGDHLAFLVAQQLELKPLAPSCEESTKPLAIRGTEGMVLHFAKCCQPIPQDPIMGFISAGKGILVHTQKCPTLAKQRQLHPENCLRLNWEENLQQTFEVEIRVELMNIPGALASVSQELAERNINIETLSLVRKDGASPELKLNIAVHNRKELATAMRAIYRTSVVHKVYRHRNLT